MAKRKRANIVPAVTGSSAPTDVLGPVSSKSDIAAPERTSKGRQLTRASPIDTNPDTNSQVLDGSQALRASPDAHGPDEQFRVDKMIRDKKGKRAPPATPDAKLKSSPSDSSLSELSDVDTLATSVIGTEATKVGAKNAPVKQMTDPEVDDDEPADEEENMAAITRKPPVDSDYIPLPWKGRLGYACLNTYLRSANPPIFSSRTCRIASILENRHPLADPILPPHPTKNRPDKDQPSSIDRGQRYVESLGLANAKDIPKMLRWNHKYGIKFMRLSSEMFPFASHEEYGYKLASFASEVLAEAGKVAAELGHRLTTHPGQFTQLGSPRKPVIDNSFRDLEYHAELLRLLKLPDQMNRDAVMILHMGGIFGDKGETLDRFRDNYAKLSQDVKNRLVLENDDMGWSVHDLLPICEELNIPLVLDFHHHNIVFDETQIREGTKDIMDLYDRITATWKRKGITQKMHYSEPTPAAITPRQRRKHSPRVKTLPPCPPDMDLMIEAKDKEQAVFELMRIFKLPGWSTFNDITPYVRLDENKPWKPPPKKKTPRKKNVGNEVPPVEEPDPQPPPIVPDDELNMGGPEGRVYWPPGMEEWLRPKKREVKKKEPGIAPTSAKKAVAKQLTKKEEEAENESVLSTTVTPKIKHKKGTKPASKVTAPVSKKRKAVKAVLTPSASDEEMEDVVSVPDSDSGSDEPGQKQTASRPAQLGRRRSGRGAKSAVKSYAEDEEDSM
ncbi:putative uv-endonuclease uve-1 [Phaeomoniella chlamydospora]|uniref:Putative uv-endonuclease uve-1 n=1 Tax=Phaeomoniella chlamydospora TaxID=158046 RepID=A0A0G2ES16_PHACM|nr:putative uv-endonuclease uve-1 [Phaeomoniella chlamydospora]